MKKFKKSNSTDLSNRNSTTPFNESSKNQKITNPLRNEHPELRPKEVPLPDELEKDWGGDGPRVKLTTGFAFLLVFFILIAVGVYFFSNPFKSHVTENATPPSTNHVASQKLEYEKTQKTLRAINKTVTDYFAANTVADISAKSRHSERVQWMMVDYYKKHQRPRLRLKTINKMKSIGIKTKPFLLLDLEVVKTNALKKTFQHQLILEQTGQFEFKVDWEVDVFYQPISWTDFIKKRPLHPKEMRVILSLDHFYAYHFRDKKKYQCYKLTSPIEDGYIFAYTERGGPVDQKIKQLFTETKDKGQKSYKANKLESEITLFQKIDSDQPHIQKKPNLMFRKMIPKASRAAIVKIRFIKEDASLHGVYLDSLLSDSWIHH